jgi:hypothetical protein
MTMTVPDRGAGMEESGAGMESETGAEMEMG